MNYKQINRIFAAIVFAISATVLFSTVQPSVSFWDCGEFIAAAFSLQVPHPPGAPLFTLLGRVFSMLPIASNVALRINYISVLASASSIMFLYLIAVKLIQNYRGKDPKNSVDGLATFICAAIGALAFSFSDTFWFNGVEAEVYATSTLLFSAITYLMILWNEKADAKDNEKYILMLAYLIGLSTGVHLMSVLAIVSVVMIIMFRKYVEDEKQLILSGKIFLGHAAVILIIAFILWGSQTGKNVPSPEEYRDFDTKFKMIMLAISAVIMGVFWKKIFNRNSIYLPFIIGGAALFITYPGIVKILPGVIASISGDHSGTAIFVFAVLLAVLGYGVYYSVKNDKRTMHLAFMSVIFILLGFTTYTMIIIRSNQNPPMNENEPNDFSELVSYLNRDQYGDFPIFMRRFASEPHQQGVYTNYDSDLDFWWRYQMNHMTTRYWLWNFAGRESWAQDAGPDIAPFNSIGNFLGKAFSIHFSGDSTNSLYCIPFLIGLIGIYFHFRKDWKMAAIFMVLFIFMGYLTAFYQNQQQPQPRERDYFYVGAFFVYGIWIAIGMRGLVGLVQEKLSKTNFAKPAIFGVLALGIVFIPFNMLKTNYHTHNRSNNWVPWDYSYNILQSCAPNAVLFTNGDNDTFPLWYLQDVEGVRRDVKIVCLSLANTPWYIRELKNNDPYNVGTIEIRLSDQQIDRIGAVQWKSQNITLPIPQDINTDRMDIQDSSLIKSGSLTFTMNSTLDFGNIKAVRVQDLIVKEIIEANNWQRPIYFASTTSVNSKIGLNNLLKLEGMASRLVPENKRRSADFINLPALTKGLLQENNSYNKNFERGFKFRGLHKGDMFINDNQARMLQNYRNAFLKLAFYYVDNNQRQQAIAVMDSMMSKINKDIVLMDYDIYAEIGNVYLMAGATDKYKKIASEVEKEALQALEINSGDISAFRVLLGVYQNTNDYKNLLKTWKKLQKLYPNDPNVRQNVLKYQQLTDSLKQ
jgi:hypothetical protein